MVLNDRVLAFWFLTRYCGEVLDKLEKIDFNDRKEKVAYDYLNGGNKNRSDYEFLVEQYRIFQKLKKDNWIIVELLK